MKKIHGIRAKSSGEAGVDPETLTLRKSRGEICQSVRRVRNVSEMDSNSGVEYECIVASELTSM